VEKEIQKTFLGPGFLLPQNKKFYVEEKIKSCMSKSPCSSDTSWSLLSIFLFVVYYESIKRELKIGPI
jgi:hypothetical protein